MKIRHQTVQPVAVHAQSRIQRFDWLGAAQVVNGWDSLIFSFFRGFLENRHLLDGEH